MRLSILVFLFGLATFSGTLVSGQYPYVAAISVPEVQVRSGPDHEFYATSQLRLGDRVEVYYETEDWCAIRPPVGSFSWVGAKYVELGTNGIGTVVAEGLASRIGSENNEFCETVQVKLKKGEKILVLDRRETPENTVSPVWLKIAPPRGEYRWIERAAITGSAALVSERGIRTVKRPDRYPEDDDSGDRIVQVVYEEQTDRPTSTAQRSTSTEIPRLRSTGATRMNPRSVAGRPTAPPKNLSAVEKAPVEPTSVTTTEPENAFRSMPSPTASLDLSSLSEKIASSRPDSVSISRQNPATTDPFQIAFEELKEETRIVLTRPTEDWVFETLIHRGNELFEIAPEKDLEKVYHLVETLQRTREVRQEIAMRRQFRTDGLLQPPPSALPTRTSAAPSLPQYGSNATSVDSATPGSLGIPAAARADQSRIVPASLPVEQDDSQVFDVIGRLGDFESPPHGYPPYGLGDEKGQVICLITPATGLDLKPFIGKTVGINGVFCIYARPNKPNARHLVAREIQEIK